MTKPLRPYSLYVQCDGWLINHCPCNSSNYGIVKRLQDTYAKTNILTKAQRQMLITQIERFNPNHAMQLLTKGRRF